MSNRISSASEFLRERIANGDFPSAVYLVAENGEIRFADAVGNAVVKPQTISASLETIYDLASLTKPLITGLLCARRIESGEFTLDSSIAHYLPEFDRTDKQEITLLHLLTHSSGLPAWRPLYILTENEPDRTLAVISNLELEVKPGAKVIYSDLGYITLGLLLERATGKSIARLAQDEIFQPLGLKQTFFNPEQANQTGIAACETGNGYERETCRDGYSSEYSNWREGLIWGEVHDGNAYFLGGAAGHAGLFSSAAETLKLANQFHAGLTSLLKPETCKLFSTDYTAGLNESRSPGWQLAATAESTAGPDLPVDSFGHNGFTGTCCWNDPHGARTYILLTNRTHERSLPFENINRVRRFFHTLAVAALEQS